MELRKKFVLLALIYVLSLCTNLVVSAYCIAVYFGSAFQDFQSGAVMEQQVDHLRQVIAEQRALLRQAPRPTDVQARYMMLEQSLQDGAATLVAERSGVLSDDFAARLDQAIAKKHHVVTAYFDADAAMTDEAFSETVRPSFMSLAHLLLEAGTTAGNQRDLAVAQAAQTQSDVITILIVNTAAGGLLCAIAVVFVRRWVLQPVDDLREATKQIAQGRFDYRIQPRSRDELGQLASEVNQMAATIVDMQTKMIEQERLAAAGEMVTRLAHNIRNPLAGIRGLSETTLQLNQDDAETVGCQERIIATVDRFEKWLRDLQQSVSPLTIQPKPVAIEALLADTLAALQPMLDRHNVSVEKQVDPNLKHVSVDGGHFEQAVVSLVTNAIQASNRGQTVRLRVEGVPGDSGHWRFSVEDEGAGVPAELREKIFEPYFTTKPDGNGIGLSTARKVVRLHGGQLSVESEEGRGSRFEMYMPGADKDT